MNLASPQASDHCTIGFVSSLQTDDQRPYLFSNSDNPYVTRTQVVVVHPKDGYQYVATQIQTPDSECAYHNMPTRGVNEKGLAYTWAMVRPDPMPNTVPGLDFAAFGQQVLSSCQDLSDVRHVIKDNPLAIHGNFVFADDLGQASLFEICLEHCFEHPIEQSILRTNHWVSPQCAAYGPGKVAASSSWRLQRAKALLSASSGVTRDTLSQLLSDHQGRGQECGSICQHGTQERAHRVWAGTVSSEIIDVQQRCLWYCYGWPCGSVPENSDKEPYQAQSWPAYQAFSLDDLEPGLKVDINGQLV